MDHAKFGLAAAPATPLLAEYGWRPDFDRQTGGADRGLVPVRITAVHRSRLRAEAPGLDLMLPAAGDPDDPVTVGDWVMADAGSGRIRRRLERFSLLQRRAAGGGGRAQPIAANVDTLFVVTSCNAEFSAARLERYLATARAGGVVPVVLLTKADLADPAPFAAAAGALMPGLLVEPLDARDPAAAGRLAPWLGRGQSVAFAGSSGVGKTTLVNTLAGAPDRATREIREDDAKGRHTTTARAMVRLPTGAWVIDTPGMRELGLAEAGAGIGAVFPEIEDLARGCRFSDCAHEREPGCAVRAAAEAGILDPARLARWRKLVAEDARNAETAAERRARDRSFGRMVREAARHKR